MNIIGSGNEEDKFSIGFQMFNTSGKEQMNYEDFKASYMELVMNWSVLLGEKATPTEDFIKETFKKLDRGNKGVIDRIE